MQKKTSSFITSLVLGIFFIAANIACAAGDHSMMHQKGNMTKEVLSFQGEHTSLWRLKAYNPLLIGGYGDNFSYDGSHVVPMLGKADAVFDTDKDTGTAIVRIKGTIHPEKDKQFSGNIMLVYRVAKAPMPFQEGGVADFVYLHGDTGQGEPVMPKSKTYLGVWGKADLYVNGQLVYKDLMGHIMYTERTRDLHTWAVYNHDRSGFYSPKSPADGSVVAENERELHFVAHSMGKDKGNFPPHDVFIHINFGKVIDISGGYFAQACGMAAGKSCPGCMCNKSGMVKK